MLGTNKAIEKTAIQPGTDGYVDLQIHGCGGVDVKSDSSTAGELCNACMRLASDDAADILAS